MARLKDLFFIVPLKEPLVDEYWSLRGSEDGVTGNTMAEMAAEKLIWIFFARQDRNAIRKRSFQGL